MLIILHRDTKPDDKKHEKPHQVCYTRDFKPKISHKKMMKFLDKLPFAHQNWFLYLRLLFRQFMQDECQQKAASLTYTTLLSIVPVLTVVLVIFSSIPALESVRDQVQTMIYDNVMPSSGEQIRQHLQSFTEKSSNLGIVGVVGLFVTAILTLNTIEHAFNHIWRVPNRSGGFGSLIRYWVMITLGPIVLGVIFGASSAIQSLSFLNQKFAGYGIDWGAWGYLLSFCLMALGFVGMYWLIPKTQVPIKNAAIAGIVIAILFELLKQIFGTVMSNFTSYEAIYGAFAALPIFLMWIYLSWNLVLLGVQISHTLTVFDGKHSVNRHSLISLLKMLNLTYKQYQLGSSVSEQDLRTILSSSEQLKWGAYLQQLLSNNLLITTKNNEYTLKTDLKTINLWHFCKKLPYPLPTSDDLERINLQEYEWLTPLQSRLNQVEKTAEKQLNITLGELFDGVEFIDETDMIDRSKDTVTAIADTPSLLDRFSQSVRNALPSRKE